MISRKIWSQIFEVCFSLGLAIWIPLKLLYFHDSVWVDFGLDAVCLSWFAFDLKHNGFRHRSVYKWGWAVPFFTIFTILPLELSLPLHFLLLPKLLFLRNIIKIRSVLEEFDNLHPVFYRLISLGTFLPVIIHGQACAWIALGSGTAGPDPDHVTEYIKALYWTLTTLTTIGYGDISAKTNPQMLFACVAEVVGVAFFGYVLSNVASLLARLDAAREHHLATLDRVESFIRYNKLPQEFRSKIRGYYRYLWENHRGFDDKSILDSLPRLLKVEASFLMNKDIVPKVPFLKNAPIDLVTDIVFQLKPVIATPGENLFYRGEVGDTMFFIHHGEIDILGPNNEILVTLRDGGFFGEMALLMDAPRSASARTRTYCDLFVLEKDAFQRVIEKHPGFRNSLEEVIQERMKKTG